MTCAAVKLVYTQIFASIEARIAKKIKNKQTDRQTDRSSFYIDRFGTIFCQKLSMLLADFYKVKHINPILIKKS